MPPPAKMDPDRDGCGLIWCSPVAPADGSHATTLANLSSKILLDNGFEPLLSITLVSGRSIICVISITYDREVTGEDERASRCAAELETQLSAKGYLPYRLGIQSMDQLRYRGAYGALLSAIKKFVDPADILSPGRYAAGLESKTLGA
jgi:4-cresol dehydrogenase (hydroxylating)